MMPAAGNRSWKQGDVGVMAAAAAAAAARIKSMRRPKLV